MLPLSIKEKYLERIDQLIQKGEKIPVQAHTVSSTRLSIPDRRFVTDHRQVHHVDWRSFVEWRTSCVSILDQVVPKTSAHRGTVDTFKKLKNAKDDLDFGVSFLKAIRDDLERGMLDDLALEIEAEVSGDYMGQAESLLREGQKGSLDHVPAAVLAGAVLEKSLRTLCAKQDPPVPTVNENGEPLKLNRLIDALKKANLFNELAAKELRAWAAVRNHAAHGEFDQFDRSQVESMMSGTRTFLARRLS